MVHRTHRWCETPIVGVFRQPGGGGTWASSLLQTGAATISVPGEGDIDVSTAHIPNGSKCGWKKIDPFHVLSAGLRGASDSPRILTGDFSEPELFGESGQIVTIGEGTYPAGEAYTRT